MTFWHAVAILCCLEFIGVWFVKLGRPTQYQGKSSWIGYSFMIASGAGFIALAGYWAGAALKITRPQRSVIAEKLYRLMVAISRQHWFCIVPLVPALVMMALHEILSISDAMGGVPVGGPVPTIGEEIYNVVMGILFYLGVLGYFAAALNLGDRGAVWVVVKVIGLGIGWWALLTFWPAPSA